MEVSSAPEQLEPDSMSKVPDGGVQFQYAKWSFRRWPPEEARRGRRRGRRMGEEGEEEMGSRH